MHFQPYDEAAAVAREDYEKELERYRKTEAYKSFESKFIQYCHLSILPSSELKSDVRHGLLDSNEIKKQQKSVKKTGGSTSLKFQSKKQFKLGFEIFSDTFKEFNRRREDEIKKLRKNANKLEEEIEDIEEKIEEIQKKKVKFVAEDQESQIIEKRCKDTLDRYQNTILNGMTERTLEQFGLKKDSTVKEIISALTEARKNPTLSQHLKKQIEGLRFN